MAPSIQRRVKSNSPTRPAVARRAPATPAPAPAQVDIHARLQWEYVDITDITPYEFNPRDNSEAIQSVKESILTYGFNIPCVIDANNVMVAGHTRLVAAMDLGMLAIPCLRASHLTEHQIRQFRVIDNKVASLAKWDFDLLGQEIASLRDTGINFTKFGWTQEEIDCMSEVVAAECLSQPVVVTEEERAQVAERRAPATARIVIGEIVFFIPATVYRAWADGVRQLNNFNEDAIVADLKRRLQILE